MTTVIEHPAMSLTMRTNQTFSEFAEHVWRTNKRELRHKNGSLIELDSELTYSFLLLGMERLFTDEEFAAVKVLIEEGEEQGKIPKGLVITMATPFDVPARPAIPPEFVNELEEGGEIKTYLTASDLSFTLAKVYPPLPEEEPENTEIDE
jgi:hypothetical protein